MDPIIIIGSGLAGYTLARELRRLDSTLPIQIITADDGTYYSKPQLSSALTHHKSAQALAGASAERMSLQLQVDIVTKTLITAIDPLKQIVFAGAKTFPYASLILAQGADVIKVPGISYIKDKVVSVNNLQDYIYFRELIENKRHISVLGSGLVGCEFGNDLCNGAYEIDIITLSATPLDKLLPPIVGKVFQLALAEHNIHWHLEKTIKQIDVAQEKLILHLNNGDTIKTDILLAAIGLKPVLSLAISAGIKTQRGIMTDKYLRTNQPNIYALGDCAEVEGHLLFYVASLVLCARALAQTLAGQLTPVSYPPMPIILKTPACPVVVAPPPLNLKGKWEIKGESINYSALFYDAQKNLRGFCLLGDAVQEKIALTKELPALL
jgi:rubredoxin-NAD+ reductase